MPTIRITEQKNQVQSESFSLKITFGDSEEFEGLIIHNPLTPQNKAKLEWHFEKYVSHPYLKDVEPQEAANIIREAGENLFNQLFDRRDIYSRYRQIIEDDIENLIIEINGTPEFHSLHWEALKDPDLPNAFALNAPILRKDLRPQSLGADVRETSYINLLIVTSRPAGRNDVGYRTISRPLIELLRNAQLPVKVHILRPATYESLSKHLYSVGKGFYHVVHFDVHGALLTYEGFEKIEQEKSQGNLTFQIPRYGRPQIEKYTGKDAFLFFDIYREPENTDDDGFRADPVKANELSDLLKTYGVPLIILNACQSAKELGEQEKTGELPIAEETSLASYLMKAGTQMVLAMAYSVTVTAAKILMENFYKEIFRGKTINQAIKAGRGELNNRKFRRAAFNYEIPLEDWLLPVVYQKRNIELKTKTLTAQEEEILLNERAEVGNMPAVEYGFHGRDIDILNIERRVLLKNNILLIRGMGGAGKTTLLKHLAWWWRATGFIGRIFYFGYDEKAYTRQEIMFRIAETLYDKYEFANFQAMNETAQMQKLALRLRNERHLLILDNLESIQGGYFAVKNTLSADEQTKLKNFLAELCNTSDDAFQPQTIVLLGSRSAEKWLASGTFDENLYDLGGLDRESATQFAEEILRRNGILKYKTDDDFKKLLKLLAGFPLPLKVVFENLKQKTPAEILDALSAGDVDLNTGTTEEKTADILKCIEYSHSNIAPEKQELLLCLAPFISVVNRNYFQYYIEELKRNEVLTDLRHELWDEVFAESIERGLMWQSDATMIYYLQPILPYFLKTEWRKTGRENFRIAVQEAFRDYFNNVSSSILSLIKSSNLNDVWLGKNLMSLEFENIETCLEYSLTTHNSISASFLSLSNYYDNTQNHQAGLELGEKVLNKMENLLQGASNRTFDFEFVYILYDIGNRHLLLRDHTKAVVFLEKSLEYLDRSQYIEAEDKRHFSAAAYKDLAIVAYDLREWQKAEKYNQKAFQIFKELNVEIQQAEILYNLGLISSEKGDFERAEQYYHDALQTYRQLNDVQRQGPLFQSLGVVKYKKGDLEQAKYYWESAQNIYKEFNDQFLEARVLGNLGALAQEKNDWHLAQVYLQQSLEIYIEINEQFWQAHTFNNLGVTQHGLHEWKQAEDYYKKALEIFTSYNEQYQRALTFLNLGLLAKDQSEWRKAENYYLEALKIFNVIDEQDEMNRTLFSLYGIWQKTEGDLLTRISEIVGLSEAQVKEMFETTSKMKFKNNL